MERKSYSIFSLLLFNITFFYCQCSSILYIPFKSFNPYKDHSYDFFSEIFSNEIYVNLSLSENSNFQIQSIVKLDLYSFLIPDSLLINDDKPISPSFNSSLNYTKLSYDYFITSVANASDIFHFKTYNSTTKKNETINSRVNFLISNSNSSTVSNKFGVVGFKLPNKNFDRSNGCFIDNLKKAGLIGNYIWNIRYSIVNKTYYEGEIVIGDYLHSSLYYKYYNASDYIYFHPAKEGSNLFWDILFDQINISGFQSDEYWITSKQASIDPYINVILGPSDFKRAVSKHFFTDYIKKKICFEEHIKKYNNVVYYVCYNDTNENNNVNNSSNNSYFSFENFSTINFQHEDYNFVLNADDLFMQDPDNKNIFYFLVVFYNSYDYDYGEEEYWILGVPFLKKYAFTFDPNNKIMGVYTQMRKINIDEKSFFAKYWGYFLVGLFLCILIGGGVFLGIWLYNNKNKKREIKKNEIPENDAKIIDDNMELNMVDNDINE